MRTLRQRVALVVCAAFAVLTVSACNDDGSSSGGTSGGTTGGDTAPGLLVPKVTAKEPTCSTGTREHIEVESLTPRIAYSITLRFPPQYHSRLRVVNGTADTQGKGSYSFICGTSTPAGSYQVSVTDKMTWRQASTSFRVQ